MTGHDWLLLGGAIATVVSAWIAAKYASRSSVQVATINREVQQETTESQSVQSYMEGLRKDLERGDRERASLAEQVEGLRQQLRERDRRDEADRIARIGHGGWDFTTSNVIHEHAMACPDPNARAVLLGIGPPPPMYAPPQS